MTRNKARDLDVGKINAPVGPRHDTRGITGVEQAPGAGADGYHAGP